MKRIIKSMKFFTIFFAFVLLFSCGREEDRAADNLLPAYLKSLKTLSTPLAFDTNGSLGDMSPAYDSALFVKYKHAWAYRPYGKVVYDDSSVVVIDIAVGDILVPLLTTFDGNGNKVDSLNLFQGAGWDIGFHADEFVTLTADKKIVVVDSITRWDLNESEDDIIEGTEKLTVKTLIYTIDERGSIKLATTSTSDEIAFKAGGADSASTSGVKRIDIDFPLDSLLYFDSEAALKSTFGENVGRSTGYYPEGMGQYQNTLLFAGTENEVEFVWEDDSLTFSGLAYVEVDQKGAEWKTKEGITIGTTLKELENLNGKPFSFFGFGWDYSGATDWDNGELAARGIFVSLELPGGDFPPEFEGLLGDRSFPSDSSLSQKANPVVRSITIRRQDGADTDTVGE